jgi:hypothetical protein
MYLKKDLWTFEREVRSKNIKEKKSKFPELKEVLSEKLKSYNPSWDYNKIQEEIKIIFNAADAMKEKYVCAEEKDWFNREVKKKLLQEEPLSTNKIIKKDRSNKSNFIVEVLTPLIQANTTASSGNSVKNTDKSSSTNISATKAKNLAYKVKKTQKMELPACSDKKNKLSNL